MCVIAPVLYPGSICSYSHYIFSLLDTNNAGSLTFQVICRSRQVWGRQLSHQEFIITLAMLVKGTEEDLFNWTFNLYDTNGDGFISREEMSDVVKSVSMIPSNTNFYRKFVSSTMKTIPLILITKPINLSN